MVDYVRVTTLSSLTGLKGPVTMLTVLSEWSRWILRSVMDVATKTMGADVSCGLWWRRLSAAGLLTLGTTMLTRRRLGGLRLVTMTVRGLDRVSRI